MTVFTFTNRPWIRHHDPLSIPARPNVAKIICFDTLVDLIQICASRTSSVKLKGSGSHWGLSEAALSDGEAIETNWPGPEAAPRHSGLDVDLDELFSEPLFQFLAANPPGKAEELISDPCLQESEIGSFYVHVKSGTRIYQVYALLDQLGAAPGTFAHRLNEKLGGTPNANAYDGPWAFTTLGGAGGQTVFGALTTGTHGGDYKQQPISDSVAALHLVTDGGDHYWIERRSEFPITDDNKLQEKYGSIPDVRFSIIRDSEVFDAVVVSAGRFGVIASLVLRVVPQYCLHEHRVLEDWSEVKRLLKTTQRHRFFDNVYFPALGRSDAQTEFNRRFGNFTQTNNRFLQIAVNTCPHRNNEHRCGVTQRWFASHGSPEAKNPDGSLRGRNERGTDATAGMTFPYEPTEDPTKSGSSSGTFLQKACANGNFIAGVLNGVADAIQEVIDDGFVPAAGIAVTALGIGAGAVVLAIASICLLLAAIVAILRALADDVEAAGDVSLTQVVDAVVTKLLNDPDIPRPIALMTIRMIFLMIFETQQSKRDFVALSYAVMDTHDYKDRSCFGNAYSIEVFFDASRPDIYCTYVDQILAFEAAQQENDGRVTAGYISLRYVRGSRGLIAPSRFAETVVIEVAGIRDAAGTVPFVNNAVAVARHPQFAAPFHWGQFNPLSRAEVERIFNSAPRPGSLDTWRRALRDLTLNGLLDGFSSDFTRRTGLEP
jgi:hypothetical protein